MTEAAHVAEPAVRRGVVLPRVTEVPGAELFSPGLFAPDMARTPTAPEAWETTSETAETSAAPVTATARRRRRRAGLVVASLVGVAVLAAIPALLISPLGASRHPTTSAADRASSARSIMSYASNRCISVSARAARDGSALQILDCQGASWQKWSFRSDGTIRSMGMCMDLAWGSPDDGTTIQLARCHGGPAQHFDLNSAGDLVNVGADKCVDVKDMQTGNGTRLQLWQCGGTSNQKWSAV